MRTLYILVAIACGTIYFAYQYHRFAYRTCGDIACIQVMLSMEMQAHGLDSATRDLAEIYRSIPWTRSSCFALALGLGEALAGTSTKPEDLPYAPITTVCNYGVYQAYPRSLLLNGAPAADVARFCERVGVSIGTIVPDAEAECFRGIGRGLPFVSGTKDVAQMASTAIDECLSLASSRHSYEYCVAGVFNILARESVNGTNGLSIDASDPLWLCDLQVGNERRKCLGNWKWTAVSLIASSTLDEIPPIDVGFRALQNTFGYSSPFAREIASALGYDAGRRGTAGTSDIAAIAACRAAPPEIMGECLNGYAVGLAKHGLPLQQYHRVIRFCDSARDTVPGLDVTTCARDAIAYLHGAYPTVVRERMCYQVRKLGTSCLDLVNRAEK